jgi:hypothetical protein
MFIFVNSLWGPRAGLLAGVLYGYAPYHLVDAFVRGAYSELTAFIWFPLIIFGFNRLIVTRRSVYIFIAGFSMAGLILSHNIMTMLFLPFVLFYVLLDFPWRSKDNLNKRRAGLGIVGTWCLGLGLSAFFWIPVLFERKYIRSDYFLQFNYQGDFVGIQELLRITQSHQLTTEVGIVLLVGTLLAGILSLLGKLKNNRAIFLWAVVSGGIALFLTTRFSSFIWEIVPFLEFAQFPWRFLALIVFFLSLVCGALPAMISNPWLRGTLVAGLIIGAIGLSRPLQSIPNRLEAIDLSQEAVCTEVWGTQDYRPVFSRAPFWRGLEAPEEPGVLSPCPVEYKIDPMSDLRISAFARRGTHWRFQVDAETEASISFSQFFYPGWIASEDGNQLSIEPDPESGLIRMIVPEGSTDVILELSETIVRAVANLITTITFSGFLVMIGIIAYKALQRRS